MGGLPVSVLKYEKWDFKTSLVPLWINEFAKKCTLDGNLQEFASYFDVQNVSGLGFKNRSISKT